MQPALTAIQSAVDGTIFDGDVWVVGGAVRDELLGIAHANDIDLVTRGSSAELARLLFDTGISSIPPVTYERFGTALVRVEGVDIELVTARRESYDENSRKPTTEPATYEQDALRRDFTVNTLMRNLRSGQLWDPLGAGIKDLEDKVLRTPQDPIATFVDDPLRMLRAVRFRWKLGFSYAPSLGEAIREASGRLEIISAERIRDELIKILALPDAPSAMNDLMDLDLLAMFAPEFLPMVGCDQGKYHHLDVWDHTLLVLKNAGHEDLHLSLAALLHDVGKPSTRTIDGLGNTRFFSHEAVGEKMTHEILRRLKFAQRDIDVVAMLVKNHMRLGSAPLFTPSGARRVLRDLGDQTERLLKLVEADMGGLKPGVKTMDLGGIRSQLESVRRSTPAATLKSPLTGDEIMEITGAPAGPEVGRIKAFLTEKVLDGELAYDDKAAARRLLEQRGQAG